MTTHGHRGRFIHTRSFTNGMLRAAEARGATMRLGNVTELGHSGAAVATRRGSAVQTFRWETKA